GDTDNAAAKAGALVFPGKNEAVKRAEPLAARLAKRVDFPGFDDPKLSFEEALKSLTDKFEVQFEVQELAFKAAGYADKSVLAEPVAQTPVPPMRGMPLESVLRKILARIAAPPGQQATFMLQGDVILITTADFLVSHVWGANYRGPFFPLVHPSFDAKRL